MNLLDMVANLSFEDGDFQSGVQRAESSIGGLGKKIGAVVGAGAILKLGKDALSTGMDFDSAMSQVAATLGLSQEEINKTGGTYDQLREKALEMGRSTKFSSTESAQALNNLAMAGLDTSQSMDLLPKVLTLASASGMDLSTTSDRLTNVMSSLGLMSDDTATLLSNTDTVMDTLSVTSTKANTDVFGLYESLGVVGSTARIMADPVGELSIATGILGDSGTKASEAGTHLRNIIESLGNPSKQGAAALEELGVSAWDSEGNFRPLQDILVDFNESLGEMSQEEKMQIMSKIFNQTDMSAINDLLAASGDRWDELEEAIEGAEGATQEMSETQNNNLKGSLMELSSAVEGLKIAISDKLTPVIKPIVEKLTEFATELGKVISGAEDADPKLQLLAGALIAVAVAMAVAKGISIVGMLFSLAGMAFTAFRNIHSLAGAMAVLNFVLGANPIGVVIGLIVGLIAGFVYLWNTCDSFREFWVNLWEVIKNAASVVVDALKVFFETTLPTAMDNFVQFMAKLPGIVGDFFSQMFDKISEWIWNAVSAVVDFGVSVVSSIGEFFSQIPGKVDEFLTNALSVMIDWVGSMVGKAVEVGVQFLSNIGQWFSQLPSRIGSFLSSALSNVVNWVANLAAKAIEAGSQFLSNIGQWFSQLPGRIWSFLTQGLTKAGEFASQLGSKGREAGTWFLNSLVSVVSSIPSQMVSIGRNIVSGVWNGIKSMASTFTNNVKNFFGNIVNSAKSALGIHSPSREMRDEVGKWIPAGVGVGIEREMPALRKQMEEEMNDLTNVKFTPKVDATAQLASSISAMNKREMVVAFNVDGREFNRQVVAPYQEEVSRYNNVRKVR